MGGQAIDRRSYSGLMQKPAWVLVDEDDKVVASIRADNAQNARTAFKLAGLNGARVRRRDRRS